MERRVVFLTSEQLKDSLKKCNGVMIPVASVEQCGTHGTLGIDVLVADKVSEELAQVCNMLVAPVIPYGDALEMQDYAGTVNIPTDILGKYYYSTAMSFFRAGAENIMFLASHSLNTRACDYACRTLYAEGHNAFFVDFWKACSQVSKEILSDKVYGTGHGAEQISSVSLAIDSMLINTEKAENEKPKAGFSEKVAHIYGGSNVCTAYGNFHDYCESGSWGDISSASAENGRMIIEKALKLIEKSVSEIIKK